jgi:hypothetical protein
MLGVQVGQGDCLPLGEGVVAGLAMVGEPLVEKVWGSLVWVLAWEGGAQDPLDVLVKVLDLLPGEGGSL